MMLGADKTRLHRRRAAGGFSLLEVILALAILAGAIAVLSEVARNALENARIARDITVAQLLCESKLDEITAGITSPEPAVDVPFDTTDDPRVADWLYSIEVESIDAETGLSVVRVTVAQDLPADKRPTQFSLTRWIIDSGTSTSTEETVE